MQVALNRLDEISEHYELSKEEQLVEVAKTTLSSKIVNKAHEKFAKIAVDAVLRGVLAKNFRGHLLNLDFDRSDELENIL